jgi:hypothetical protein
VDFDITDQLLIKYSVFVRYWRNKTGKVYSVPEYTHAFYANSELLIKVYISYLT